MDAVRSDLELQGKSPLNLTGLIGRSGAGKTTAIVNYTVTATDNFPGDIAIVSVTGSTPPVRGGAFGRMAYVQSLKCIVVMPWGSLDLYAMRVA